MVSLLINFANTLDPDQAQHFVGPDLGPNCLALMSFLKEFFENVKFENNQQTTKNMQNYRAGALWLSGRVLDWRLRAAGLSLTSVTVLCL